MHKKKVQVLVSSVVTFILLVIILLSFSFLSTVGQALSFGSGSIQPTFSDLEQVLKHVIGAAALPAPDLITANVNCDSAGDVDIQDLYLLYTEKINPGTLRSCSGSGTNLLYDQRIVILAGASTVVSNLAQTELASSLQQMTTKPFTVQTLNPTQTDSQSGIFLVNADSPFLQTN